MHNSLEEDMEVLDLNKNIKDLYNNFNSMSVVFLSYPYIRLYSYVPRKIGRLNEFVGRMLKLCTEEDGGMMTSGSFLNIFWDVESAVVGTALLLRGTKNYDGSLEHLRRHRSKQVTQRTEGVDSVLEYLDFIVEDLSQVCIQSKTTILSARLVFFMGFLQFIEDWINEDSLDMGSYSHRSTSFMVSEEHEEEYLDHVLEDLKDSINCEARGLSGIFIFLRMFLQFSKDNHENLQELLMCVKAIADKTARALYFGFRSWEVTQRISQSSSFVLPDMWILIVQALVLQSGAPFTDELLLGYVDCVKHVLIQIQYSCARGSPMWSHLQELHEKLGPLVQFFIHYTAHCNEQDRVSDLRIHFQIITRNVGSLIYWYIVRNVGYSNLFLGMLDVLLFPLRMCPPFSSYELMMEYVDCFRIMQPIMFSTIKDEIKRQIATEMGLLLLDLVAEIYKTTSSQSESELLLLSLDCIKQFLVWLLKKEKMDLEGIVKDQFKILHRELLFIVRLLTNYRKHYIHCKKQSDFRVLLRNITEDIIKMSINDEMIEKMGIAMNPALSYLLIGSLKALMAQLDSSPILTDELHVRSLDCIQQILTGLLKDAEIELARVLRDQVITLHEELGLLVRLITNFQPYMEWEKLLDEKIQLQVMARDLGPLICSFFNSKMRAENSLVLPSIVEKVCIMKASFMGIISHLILQRLRQTSPRTNLLGFLNFLLENLKELIVCKFNFVMELKDQLQIIYEGLLLFRSFVQNIAEARNTDDESKDLCERIRNVAYEAEYLIYSFAVGACHVCCRSTLISKFTEEIELIKADMVDVIANKASKSLQALVPKTDVSKDVLLRATSSRKNPIQTADVLVGFDDEIELILKRLASNSKELDVVAITGMPGLGKTTLAEKVYQHPYTVNHFHNRAWCCVSPVYDKKDLLITILGCIVRFTDELNRKTFEYLSVMLHKELTGRKYLIVMDDIWGLDAFEDVKRFFPDNANGSRIMLTSRSKLIGSQTSNRNHLELRFLTEDESWDLLVQKVYRKKKIPLELCEVGKEIAQKCKGLPLAVVVVAGLLSKSENKLDFWRQVAGNLSLHISGDSQHLGLEALDLSYKFLPDHLKPLFLYLGAFPENEEISAKKLKWLWIAEGFVVKNRVSSLEDQAEINLKELIDRNLLMVAKRKYDGGVKTCRVHHLLRDLSLAKAKEENIWEQINVYGNLLPDSVFYHRRVTIPQKAKFEAIPTPSPACEASLIRPLITYENLQMLSMVPPLQSLLHFYPYNDLSTTSVFSYFKLLRVMHFQSNAIYYDLYDALEMVHLRYISITILRAPIPSSITSLVNLETLIVKGLIGEIAVPDAIWQMVNLRHLHINDRARFSNVPQNSSKLQNLESLSTPIVAYGEENELIKRSPNLRKLRCLFVEQRNSHINNSYQLPQLDCLNQLESLKVLCNGRVNWTGQFNLPLTLKKLTLLNFRLQWNDISILQNLPKLEVLKLRSGAVIGELWDMRDEDRFHKLRFLKFESLNFRQWILSSDNFPCLEKVIFKRCKELKEIPHDLGDVYSLVKMEVLWGSASAVASAIDFQQAQKEEGNHLLHVNIYPPVLDK